MSALPSLPHCLRVLAAALLFGAGAASGGVADPDGAHYGPAMNYRLHCEGCHKQDGSGQPGFVPDFRGTLSRFLALPEGRAYLARVPGTAQSLLTDEERAAVLNWIVTTMDPGNVPADFQPYSESEVAQWRYDALSTPLRERARLLAQLDGVGVQLAAATADDASPAASAAAAPSTAPTAFTVCASCHTVTRDGAHSMGPNLAGVVGRRAGSIPGYAFSPAMRDADIDWSPENIDAYLQAPSRMIPGTFMMAAPVKDPAARKAIIDYLTALR